MTRFTKFSISLLLAGAAAGCADPLQPEPVPIVEDVAFAANGKACWGQATKVFAKMGEMGKHASAEATPRIGLANLARALYDAGMIPAPTMDALGAFVASALGFSIDACM